MINRLQDAKGSPKPGHFRDIPDTIEIEEIKAFIDLELPKVRHKREKLENERVIMQTLVKNIEKNRQKWRADMFEAEGSRRLAL